MLLTQAEAVAQLPAPPPEEVVELVVVVFDVEDVVLVVLVVDVVRLVVVVEVVWLVVVVEPPPATLIRFLIAASYLLFTGKTYVGCCHDWKPEGLRTIRLRSIPKHDTTE